MEIVRLDGYTEDEKIVIAREHLLPRQLERAGLAPDEVTIEEAALRKLAGEYTREAGVRNLERSIARLLRKVAAQHELGERELPFTVTEGDLRGLIGRPHHVPESAQEPAERRTAVPGVATGLAVTGAGGDVLYVEASLADPETGLARPDALPQGLPWQEPEEVFVASGRTDLHASIDTEGRTSDRRDDFDEVYGDWGALREAAAPGMVPERIDTDVRDALRTAADDPTKLTDAEALALLHADGPALDALTGIAEASGRQRR